MTENEKVEKYFNTELSMLPEESLDSIECEEIKNICLKALEEIQECRAIGTIEEFKALKEKSVAKKPHSISIANDIGNSMVECPICHARSDYDIKSIKKGHCWRCGQKLDWSE